MFTESFRNFASAGDSIECRVTVAGFGIGLRFVATLYDDDDKTPPDERQDGFWPSLDPQSSGYIGPKSASTLARHTRKARRVMEAWNNDEWSYVGIDVRAYFDDTPLTDEFAHALWGVECNYPAAGNSYLRDVANENLHDCAQEAIRALSEMVGLGAEVIDLERDA